MKQISFTLNDAICNIYPHKDSPVIVENKVVELPISQKIIGVAITNKLIILLFDDYDPNKPVLDAQKKRTSNNVIACDHNGNILWNISDIVGVIDFPFVDVNVVSLLQLKNLSMDIPLDGNHEYLHCHTLEGMNYVIDVTNEKLICKFICK